MHAQYAYAAELQYYISCVVPRFLQVVLLASYKPIHSFSIILFSSPLMSAAEPVLPMGMARPIQFIKQEVAVRHRIRSIRHVEIVIESVQLLRLRWWRYHPHAHPLLLRMLCREAKIDRLLVYVRVAVRRHVRRRRCLWLW